MSAPKHLNPELFTTREMLVLGDAAVYSVAEVEAAAEDSARLEFCMNHLFIISKVGTRTRRAHVNRMEIDAARTLAARKEAK